MSKVKSLKSKVFSFDLCPLTLLVLDSEWVLTWIELTCWERSVDILNAEQTERLEENLSTMIECVSTVVWEALANEYVTIEACESRDSVDTDTTE